MRYFLLIYFAWILLPNQALAIKIFRSPDSPLSSGEENINYLKERTHTVISHQWYQIQWKGKKGWLPADSLFTTDNLVRKAQTLASTPLRRRPEVNRMPFTVISPNQPLLVLKKDENWAKVSVVIKGRPVVGWTDFENIKGQEIDWGFAYAKKPTTLRNKPVSKAPILKKVKMGKKLIPISFHADWVRVRYHGQQGYVPIKDLLTKVDFADKIKINNAWAPIRGMTGPWLRVNQQEFGTLAQIQGIKTVPNWAFIAKNKSIVYKQPSITSGSLGHLPWMAPVQVVETRQVKWGKAKIRRRQRIWWRMEELSLNPTQAALVDLPLTKGHLDTSDVFSRPIFDIASSPVIHNLTFVSADGIYLSIDGTSWEKLTQFKNNNFPINIAKSGTVYIGPYKSTDHGQTFESYIRWERILPLITQKTRRAPKKLQIQKIKILDSTGQHLRINVHSDRIQSLNLETKNGGLTWHYTPSVRAVNQILKKRH